jgi:raffinose/stachyose/melibiose transport system substrate-binding protein
MMEEKNAPGGKGRLIRWTAFFAALLVTIGLVILWAANNQDMSRGKEHQQATPAPETIKLNTVSMFGGTDPSASDYQRLIKSFMEQNPQILIMDESSSADETWKAKVTIDFASGNDPDVAFYFTGPDARQIIENGKVVSIDEIKALYPDYAKEISPNAMRFMEEFDGKTYAVPIRGYYEGLFCNKDLFDQYGLELPTDWDKLEKAIARFSKAGIVPIAASFSDVPHYWIEHLILAQGGIEEHRVNPIATYPESWVKGLSYFKYLRDMGAFSSDVNITKNDIASNLFIEKKAAMIIEGSWFIGGLKDPETTVILPMPATPDGKKNPSDIIGGYSSGFYISTKAWNNPEKRDAAVKFVMHMTSREAIAAFAKVAGPPAADIQSNANISRVMQSGITMSSNAQHVETPIDSRLTKEAWNYFVSQIGALTDGVITPEELLDEVIIRNRGQ